MPQRLQVIPLDVLEEGVRNARRRSRQKARTAQESTAESARQAKTQGKSQKVIQPVTALLYHSALAMEQEQAEAKRLQKAKPQQIIQPVTAFQFMAVLAKQLEQAEANQQKQQVAKQSSTKQQKQPTIKQQQEQPAAKPVRKRKPTVRKPPAQPTPPPVIQHAPPVQRTSPVWLRFLRGIGRAGSALYVLYGGIIGILLFLLPQALLAFLIVALLVVFPLRFPAVPFWGLLLGSGFCLVVYVFLASVHCAVVKETEKAPCLPIIGLYLLYLLAAYQLCKVFVS